VVNDLSPGSVSIYCHFTPLNGHKGAVAAPMTHGLSQTSLEMLRNMVNSLGFLLRSRDLGHPLVAREPPGLVARELPGLLR
jgi:hypothetical protein